MESKIPGYGKIWALGHKATKRIVGRRCIVEEKVDGSQLSAMVDAAGNLHLRSKNAVIHQGAVPDLFAPSVEHIVGLYERGAMAVGYVYRFESISRPRHNTLAYSRTPRGFCVLLDVDTGGQDYLGQLYREEIAEMLGVDPVPVLLDGEVESADDIRSLLAMESFLGGPLIEGVVIKPVEPVFWEVDGKRIVAKYVSEAFKETHRKTFKHDRPQRQDLIDGIVECVSTPVRWEKAIQHMREDGELTDTPRDIGGIMRRVSEDVEAESIDEIKDMLWQAHRKEIVRKSTKGIAQWYKERLLSGAFEGEA